MQLMWRLWVLGMAVGALPALADGTETKAKGADYAVHGEAGPLSIGAEYMVHSFTGRKQTFVARDFLVVEVALFAGPGERLEVSDGHFTLRVNKKTTWTASAPSFVAASLKYPDWQPRPTLEAGVGAGNGEVIVGRPAQVERFPGDQLPRARLPRAPEQDHGVERQESVRAEEIVLETALPEGNVLPPVSGFLYFPYKGKVAGIRSLELIYTGPAGSAVLKLR